MAGKTRDLKIRFRALDRVSKTIDRVRKKFGPLTRAVRKASRVFRLINARTAKFRNNMMKMGRGFTNAGRTLTTRLTAPIGLAGAAILKTGVDFQRSMNKVGAITRTVTRDGSTGMIIFSDSFKAMEKEALKLGATTEFSASQAADAMVFLGRAGFEANQVIKITGQTLALASASGSELAFTADTMAKTIKQFGLEAGDAGRVADVLADVSRRTNVSLETIAETFQDAGPIAKTYGATLEQTAAITGLLGDVGIQGSKAGTALKNIFLKLAAPSDKARKFMEAMGVSVTDANGNMKEAGAILSEVAPKLALLNKDKQLEVANELFGLRGIAGASALMSKALKDGKNPIETLTNAMKDNTGTASDMRAIMQAGAVGAMSRFQSALEGVGLAFSKSGLLDAFTDFLISITKALNWLGSLNPAILKWIAILGGLVATLGPVLAMIGFMIQGIAQLSFILGILKGIMIVIGVIAGGISLPFLAIAAAIAAVVAVVVRLYTKWGDLVKAFKSGSGILNGLKKAASVFFGFGGGDEAKAGSKKSTFGPESGARAATSRPGVGVLQTSNQQTNNAAVTIDLKGFPSGTKARSEKDGPLDFNLGFSNGVL